jgi:uncharacterized protein (DUF427 family)
MAVDAARGRVKVETAGKRVRGYAGGVLIFDTVRPLLVWEVPYYPAYYIPVADVRVGLEATGATERSPSRGAAAVHDLVTPRGRIEAAALRYDDSPLEPLRAAVRFRWDALDEWLEEDEPIYGHPRDPYKRVDVLRSSRHVRVELDGVPLADSTRPTILFETSLPPRYYLPFSDVRAELLESSPTRTLCPYKGWASYWHLVVDGRRHEDLVWMYRSPFAESQKIAGLVCFYNEKVDLVIDGERLDRPRTPFS